jgi:mRNA-decapping enzyme subunit 2
VEKYSNLPSYKFKTFTEKLFSHCQLLQPLQDQCSVLCDDFNTYRYQIPVCGCILLNSDMTKVVLVRNWKGTSWSFPKGKINEDETSYHCALRETFEETGFNPVDYCQEEHYLVVYEEKKVTRLYIAVGVPETTVFNTQTRKEISRVEFHSLDQLPKKAWGVHPFLEKLQRWIRKHQKLIQGACLSCWPHFSPLPPLHRQSLQEKGRNSISIR